MADCKELARLQTIYPKSEYQRIDATVEEKSLTVLCNYVKDQSHSLMLKPYPSDVEELSHRLHNKQKIVSKLKQELTTSAEDHVPRLLRESATSQVNRILQGDYDLKVARQDYFILNQDKVTETNFRPYIIPGFAT
ncbi:HAUS augmin-like complex subunit 3 [Lineus longissimus]|uniref:HAUS augmin-like complex subunit 3 n=1 Tax=Lineus longissimus TaxID=88925 RepID=UPI00315D8818